MPRTLADNLNDASKVFATVASIISGIAFLISIYYLTRPAPTPVVEA